LTFFRSHNQETALVSVREFTNQQ